MYAGIGKAEVVPVIQEAIGVYRAVVILMRGLTCRRGNLLLFRLKLRILAALPIVILRLSLSLIIVWQIPME